VKTLHLTVNPADIGLPHDLETLEQAGRILRSGGLVAFPTETVYGLGANALDGAAVESIFAAKQRPSWDPIIVHVATMEMLNELVMEVSAAARRLMEAFWPGPLTLLLPRKTVVPDAVTAGRPLVGVRMPSHPVALELIRHAGVPVAAPSANRFAHISPTTAAHVLHDLEGRIDAVIDAGPTAHGVESTVVDPSASPMIIYRPGAITAEQMEEVAGPVAAFKEVVESETNKALPAPGMGLRHYAPRAKLVLIGAPVRQLGARLTAAARSRPDEVLGVMLPEGVPAPPGVDAGRVFAWGRWNAPEELARRLYAGLRALDTAGCTVILCPLPPAEGLGETIRDRLRKAAR
jgi:L-threonylcarbamoyladenylate synthase